MLEMTDNEESSITDGTQKALVSLLQVKNDLTRSIGELSHHMDTACKHLKIAQDIISRTEDIHGELCPAKRTYPDDQKDSLHSRVPLGSKQKLLACSAFSIIFLVLFNTLIGLDYQSNQLQDVSFQKKQSTEFVAMQSLLSVGPSDLFEETEKTPQKLKGHRLDKHAIFSSPGGRKGDDDTLKGKEDWLVNSSTHPRTVIPTLTKQGDGASFGLLPSERWDETGTFLRGHTISDDHSHAFGSSSLQKVHQRRGNTTNENEDVAGFRSRSLSTSVVHKEVKISSDNTLTANDTSRPESSHSTSPAKKINVHRKVFYKGNGTTSSGGPLIEEEAPATNVRLPLAQRTGDCDAGDVGRVISVRILVHGIHDEFLWTLYNMLGSVVARQGPFYVGHHDGDYLPWYNHTSTICVACHDQEKDCSTRAQDNQCETNSSYMLQKCSRSCNACECFTLEIGSASQSVLGGEYDVEVEGLARKRGKWNGSKLTKIGKGCKSREQVECGKKPLLAPDSEYTFDFSYPQKKRVHDILNVVASISGRNALVDVSSAQYKAACWILYDDALKLSAQSITFVQRYVLAVLFFATNGDKWEMTYDFLSPRPECTWNWLLARDLPWGDWGKWKEEWRMAGVSCNNSSKVEKIYIAGNNLEGTIVSELSKLNYLERLRLSDNTLHGFVPSELGALSGLSHLHLPRNSLQGNLPNDLFQATQLVELDVQHNRIFGSLSNHIANLTNLKMLRANDNSLMGNIPESLYKIDSLTELQLGNNSFTGTISGSIGQISSMSHCDLHTNDLTGSIPPEIGNLAKLEKLHLTGNNLAFNIPSEINNLRNITELDFSHNHLTGRIPVDLSKLQKLEALRLSENSLSGPIPSSFGALSMIRTIDLNTNDLTGLVPRSLGLLTNLEVLRLERNKLRGEIPGELCSNFTRMQRNPSDHIENWHLYYSADCLGHFSSKPVSCPCCTSCSHSSFSRTRVGPCPDGSVETSVYFQNIYESSGMRWSLQDSFGDHVQYGGPYGSAKVGGRAYTTCIASTDCYTFLSYPGKYRYRMFHNISHEGKTIDAGQSNPIHFGYSSVAKTLSKDTCDPILVCGQVEVGGPQRSKRRAMYDKLVLFSGLKTLRDSDSAQYKAACWLIDEDYKKPDARYDFFLQRYVLALLHFNTKAWATQSQTRVPPASDECEWGGITCNQEGYVSEVDLSNKYLKGSLPRELGEISSLETLNLRMNQLHGSVPLELSNLWRLREMDLSRNHFRGPIPSQIRQISNLTVLDLSSNSLSGTLPSEILHLSHLKVLDVSDNALHGSIASEIRLLSKLVFFDGSSNFFTSSIPSEINLATNLAHLDLSRNEITGNIPLGGLGSSNLRHVHLHTNRLSGSLAPALFEGSQLETIMLQNNDLTGSIPETLGESTNLTTVALSYNSFKGKVPSTLHNLESLQLLHLHGNQLIGVIDMRHSLDSFITDCGSPSTTAASKIACKSCTECCNSDGQCQRTPSDELSVLQEGLVVIAALLVFMVGISLAGMLCIKRKLLHLPVVNSSAHILCGEDSTYSLVLASSYLGWTVSLVTVFLQVMMFVLFLFAADFNESASDWEYTMRCPPNSLECEDDDSKTPFGWALFAILIATNLVPDIANGIRLIYNSASLMNFRCLIGGVILVCITALAVFTSVFYNAAIAQSNTALITNAVILLFVNDMDEMFFAVLNNLFPNWVQSRADEAEVFSAQLLTSTTMFQSTLYDYGFTSKV